jgi:23S rRNA-intervening sequence protein
METQHWIETALECEYIDQMTSIQLVNKCFEIGRMLNGMMDKADMFCGEPPRTLREDSAVYFIGSDGDEEDTDN